MGSIPIGATIFSQSYVAMTYTLVIIDMQAKFKASKKVHQRVLQEIELAKQKNAGIIILEYGGHGPTNAELLKAAYSNYTKVFRVAKGQDDGSREIANIIRIPNNKRRALLSNNLRICGVNTDACVQRTVEALIRHYGIKTVSVIADACWTNTGHGSLNGKKFTPEFCHHSAIEYMCNLGVNIRKSKAA